MPMWRCPHCGTPQAEAARCWVCRRSSTSCGTCRHFRRAVAADLGYCGLDRRRTPLAGDELRGCWQEAAPRDTEPVHPGARLPVLDRTREPAPARARLDFIEVPSGPARRSAGTPSRATRRARGAGAATPEATDPAVPVAQPDEGRWSLWADLEA